MFCYNYSWFKSYFEYSSLQTDLVFPIFKQLQLVIVFLKPFFKSFTQLKLLQVVNWRRKAKYQVLPRAARV